MLLPEEPRAFLRFRAQGRPNLTEEKESERGAECIGGGILNSSVAQPSCWGNESPRVLQAAHCAVRQWEVPCCPPTNNPTTTTTTTTTTCPKQVIPLEGRPAAPEADSLPLQGSGIRAWDGKGRGVSLSGWHARSPTGPQ
ncbi:hypothetical protein AAFF_G00379050 [Aldrovandia affinis]|uniref:Uncharacterized protein n=1 Tax=Aldrovandia affinis TaxID=143900 RepID=A0AAD7SFM9_9TELE|nr:hypothetical protein AAFF_G00379050 [Aldrovandia affinis]